MNQYESACRVLELPRDPLTERLVAASVDLAAVEMVRRRREPGNGLTARALLLLSLAEARPEHVHFFLLDQPSAARAWLTLGAAPLFAVYQWVEGTVLLWWHARGL